MASSSTPTARASNARMKPPLLACSSASAPRPSAAAAAYAVACRARRGSGARGPRGVQLPGRSSGRARLAEPEHTCCK